MSNLEALVDLARFSGLSLVEIEAVKTESWPHVFGCDQPAWKCEACHEDLKAIRKVIASVQPLIEREHLEDLEAAGRLLPEGATGEHVYLSTGCLHARAATDPDEAKRLHGYCQSMTGVLGEKRPATCKHCPAHCVCECHKSPMAVKEGE